MAHADHETTIRQIRVEAVASYHVELARHDILLAEGLPVESYLETGGRAAFANAGETRMRAGLGRSGGHADARRCWGMEISLRGHARNCACRLLCSACQSLPKVNPGRRFGRQFEKGGGAMRADVGSLSAVGLGRRGLQPCFLGASRRRSGLRHILPIMVRVLPPARLAQRLLIQSGLASRCHR